MWRQDDFLIAALGVRGRDGSEYDVAGGDRGGRAWNGSGPPRPSADARSRPLERVVVLDRRRHRDHPGPSRALRRRATCSTPPNATGPRRCCWSAIRWQDRWWTSCVHHPGTSARFATCSPEEQSSRPAPRRELQQLLAGVTIVDVLGSTESGRQGVATTSPGGGPGGGFTPAATAVVLSEDLSARPRCRRRSDRVGWPRPGGYRSDTSATPRRPAATFPQIGGARHAVAGDRARWLADGTDRAARTRLGVHQHRWREGVRRGGRDRTEDPSRRSTTRSSAVDRASGGARRWWRSSSCEKQRHAADGARGRRRRVTSRATSSPR